MHIEHSASESKGSFYILVNGKRKAEMTYSMAGAERMIIDHTEVQDVLRGKGAGVQLLHAAVDFARKNKLEVLPLCPFAAAMFKKTPDIQDVLKP